MSDPVFRELTYHRYFRERLEVAFPDADEDTLMDTLEGMTNLTAHSDESGHRFRRESGH